MGIDEIVQESNIDSEGESVAKKKQEEKKFPKEHRASQGEERSMKKG